MYEDVTTRALAVNTERVRVNYGVGKQHGMGLGRSETYAHVGMSVRHRTKQHGNAKNLKPSLFRQRGMTSRTASFTALVFTKC